MLARCGGRGEPRYPPSGVLFTNPNPNPNPLIPTPTPTPTRTPTRTRTGTLPLNLALTLPPGEEEEVATPPRRRVGGSGGVGRAARALGKLGAATYLRLEGMELGDAEVIELASEAR